VTKVGLYAIGTSTTLESNKSPAAEGVDLVSVFHGTEFVERANCPRVVNQ